MDLQQVRREIIAPAFLLLPDRMAGKKAEVMLLAIGLQESRFLHRRQINGPARSFWQGEKGGGMVHGVPRHISTMRTAAKVIEARGVSPTDDAVYAAIETDDILACALARLLLYTDPKALPEVGDAHSAWELYLRQWRPGVPRPETWADYYRQALEAVQ
ncbi:hypothetical protein [Pseudomonas tohonis]|uniref:hypothetical protein n=1 Tax=Pseudomonas tohonis TaxID=2725477 RepID=UPI0022F07BB4|nr:hypothetical protein [Pseudomonas tohonis]